MQANAVSAPRHQHCSEQDEQGQRQGLVAGRVVRRQPDDGWGKQHDQVNTVQPGGCAQGHEHTRAQDAEQTDGDHQVDRLRALGHQEHSGTGHQRRGKGTCVQAELYQLVRAIRGLQRMPAPQHAQPIYR